LPFVVGFHLRGAGRLKPGGRVGEDADGIGAALDFLVQPFEALVDQIFFQWLAGKAAKAVMSSLASRTIAPTSGNRRPSIAAMVTSWSRT